MVAKKAPAATTAVATPVAPVPAPAPKEVKAKVAKTEAAPAKTETKAAKVVEPKVAEVVPVVTEPVEGEVESPLDVVFAKITAAATLIKELQTAMKTLQKSYEKMKKVVDKQEKKKQNARTTPSGFAKPTRISDELCAFLNVPKGTQMSRTETTRAINGYIKEHNLYDPNNRRIILPDASLKKVLVLAPGELLSFFTLQKAIKHHFAPSTPKA